MIFITLITYNSCINGFFNNLLSILCMMDVHFVNLLTLAVFEQYQKARTQFVQSVAELASRPQNIETLQNAGVMSLLRPLLLDVVPTIQQTAALALGRLANYNDDLAEAVVKGDILPQLVYSLAEQNVSYIFVQISQIVFVFFIYIKSHNIVLNYVLRICYKHKA